MNPLAFALPASIAALLLVLAIIALFKRRGLVALGAGLLALFLGGAVFVMFALLLAAPAPEQITFLSNAGLGIGGLGALGFAVLCWRLWRRQAPSDTAT